MREEILQEKIIALIKSNSLLDSIKNKISLDDALKKDSDSEILPMFSIDHLLKEKYSASAKRVINNLDDYEIISGESILNISLNKTERLYPDVVLFNRLKQQLIVIENKTSSKTEREAVTELLGYAHEIRNHLPFFSDYDINFILIATEFSTLLNHSVSGQLLTSDINLLCLRPEIILDKIEGFEVHFPLAWSDIGQLGLNPDALVSYTMCLYKKEDVLLEHVDVKGTIQMAVDLLKNKATRFKSSGLYIVWRNGLADFEHECKMGITVYVINPFAFLSPAYKLGFPLNEHSALTRYLKSYIEEQGPFDHLSSLFAIADDAEHFLSNFFEVEWDRASSWQIDMQDKLFALQRFPLQWDSWGAVGDYVRYIYLHPSSKNHLFTEWEIEKGGGYLNPFIGLQIVDLLAGKKVFELGVFSHGEIFRFGIQIGFYLYACRNAMGQDDEAAASYDAFLFWSALGIIQSIKEVSARIRDTGDVDAGALFPLAITKSAIRDDYEKRIASFIEWFKGDFINTDQNPTMATIFELATKTSHYFDNYFNGAIESPERQLIESDYSFIVREMVVEITLDRRKNPIHNTALIDFLNKNYFEGNLLSLSDQGVADWLENILNETLVNDFEIKFLPFLDMIKPGLIHNLGPINLSKSVDWTAIRKTADNFYDDGNRKTSILISPNGTIGLGVIESPMSLNDKDEIFIQFYPENSAQVMTLRVRWDDLLDGSFQI